MWVVLAHLNPTIFLKEVKYARTQANASHVSTGITVPSRQDPDRAM